MNIFDAYNFVEKIHQNVFYIIMSKIYLFHSKLLFVLYYTSNIAVNDAMVINQCKYYRRHLYHIWNKVDCILINVYAIFYQSLPSLVGFLRDNDQH